MLLLNDSVSHKCQFSTAVYLLSSGSYSLEFFPRPLGRDKGTYGSFFIQDVKCGSNHREKDDKKRMGYWKLVLKHKGLLRDFFAFVFGLANGDYLSHCRNSQLDHLFWGRIINFESKDK